MTRWRSRCWLSMFRKGSSSRGFTIIEIVTVMAVMAFALGAGFYSVGAWRERGKFSGIVNGMRNAIHLTRSRAIAKQKPVVLQIARPKSLSDTTDPWKHSENYVVVERKSDDLLPEAEPSNNGRPYYWIEFQFVDDGAANYELSAGDPGSLVEIDSSLAYDDSNVMKRGQICFDGRGYAIKPPDTWKPQIPSTYYPSPQEYEVRLAATKIGRGVNLRITPLGQVVVK